MPFLYLLPTGVSGYAVYEKREGAKRRNEVEKSVSMQTLSRMPVYLNYLRTLPEPGAYISAKAIADALSLGEIQVRKDLSAASDGGKPKLGYAVSGLIRDIEKFLGCGDVNDAVLVGAGRLGRALMGYSGFERYGMNIVAAFDDDPGAVGMDASGKQVFPMEKLSDLCRRMNVRIGIITVPADSAQAVCDRLVESGVLAVWNFAPTHLNAPEHILIRSENMAASLAVLSKHLKDGMRIGANKKERQGG